MPHPGAHYWHPREVDRLLELREVEGLDWNEIGDQIGIAADKCERKYQAIMDARRAPPLVRHEHASSNSKCPEHLLADREWRQNASYAQDFTAAFFGDPPPGYSALDKRRASA